ncbi:MAG: M57 family metalloprotease [Rhodococcus sp. (in: high G+C Gram-positive bacteria)]|uniref:LGFP repeat-containing protein n=1 Tax=Rhodococcus sp. TaxID=1831 RepID=UPI002AD77ED5|nr:M57 family metalloprotease [Rhodococcus sp. (in: high G+C Gram-positive bacteria)]
MGGKILEEFNQAGGWNFFGNAVHGEADASRNGRWQPFVNGSSIYWHSLVSGGHANQIGGLIRDKWGETGYEDGPLMYPTTRELPTGPPGRFNRFEGGNIYWSQSTGAHPVWGLILNKYATKQWENGSLGFPTSDEFTTNGNGRGQHFAGGEIYWKSTTGAYAVQGDIRQQWVNSGWENGPYGYPRTDEGPGGNYNTANGGSYVGRCQVFEGGPITWNTGSLYDQGFGSVVTATDGKKTLLMLNQSKYGNAYSAATANWNSKGKVTVRPSANSTEAVYQQTVIDVNRSDVTWLGIFSKPTGIRMNSHFLDSKSNKTIENVMTHELGHAIGLKHSCDNNIMKSTATEQLTFGDVDNHSYTKLWG